MKAMEEEGSSSDIKLALGSSGLVAYPYPPLNVPPSGNGDDSEPRQDEVRRPSRPGPFPASAENGDWLSDRPTSTSTFYTPSTDHASPSVQTPDIHNLVNHPRQPSFSSRSHRQEAASPSPKRRRVALTPSLDAEGPSSIVVADMQNEGDALQILALASGLAEEREENGSTANGNHGDRKEKRRRSEVGQASAKAAAANALRKQLVPGGLASFEFVKQGIVNKEQAARLTDIFFRYHHHLLVGTTCIGLIVRSHAWYSQWSPHLSSLEQPSSSPHSHTTSDTSSRLSSSLPAAMTRRKV